MHGHNINRTCSFIMKHTARACDKRSAEVFKSASSPHPSPPSAMEERESPLRVWRIESVKWQRHRLQVEDKRKEMPPLSSRFHFCPWNCERRSVSGPSDRIA